MAAPLLPPQKPQRRSAPQHLNLGGGGILHPLDHQQLLPAGQGRLHRLAPAAIPEGGVVPDRYDPDAPGRAVNPAPGARLEPVVPTRAV